MAPPASPPRRVLKTAGEGSIGHDEYENYNETSKTYDNVRRPIGVDIIERAMAKVAQAQSKPVKDLRLLDAGCGTGNYMGAVVGMVGAVTGLDGNDGMLKQAGAKFGDSVTLVKGSVFEMPFADGSFDIVIMNQVIHHLTMGDDTMCARLGVVLKEILRVLAPGGAFVVNTQGPDQHVQGFWWSPIVPKAAERLARRLPPITWYVEHMKSSGWVHVETTVPPEPLIRTEYYLNAEGPFLVDFRNGDSTWSLATAEELEAGLAWYRKEIFDAGRAQAFLDEREAIRAKVGQTTSVAAFKPLA
jgi:ubiquinone/menaquinone biosynthesis C-methylase UbiE